MTVHTGSLSKQTTVDSHLKIRSFVQPKITRHVSQTDFNRLYITLTVPQLTASPMDKWTKIDDQMVSERWNNINE